MKILIQKLEKNSSSQSPSNQDSIKYKIDEFRKNAKYLFILGLGDSQQEFIRTKLDKFYPTKQGPIQNPNLNELMDQSATQATATAPATTTNSRPSTASSNDERQYHYCEKSGHIFKYCWFKSPNLANAE
ncbi:hypothetical protein ACJ72_06823 [Emergomyces africanus]|uniref:Uncharacterized protein n=1 Tax=Emergomyces africanus TaxID=1955775 RepID=A0A1B7NPW3_9EURO|nr:hypothetical protein ACJ72_06823 [Emergomyces africanus]